MGNCCTSDIDVELHRAKYVEPNRQAILCQAKVVRCYDGDNVTLSYRPTRKSGLIQQECRLDGIDAPEMRVGKGNPLRDRIKAAAAQSKAALEAKVLNKVVTARIGPPGKYGRPLVVLEYGGEIINDWMIRNHHAVKYNGGTKSTDAEILRWCELSS